LLRITSIETYLQLRHVGVEGVDEFQVGIAEGPDVLVDDWTRVLGQDQVLLGAIAGHDQ
jgi:hypothetical protein